jgi:hypothetical protein
MNVIKEVVIRPEWIKQAQEEAQSMGVLKNSITQGQGNVFGFLGEIMVADFLQCQKKNTMDYDLLHGDIRIDVKTKACTSTPRLSYDCSVAAMNTTQKCDYYVFVRVLKNMKIGWILGYKSKDDYYKEAKFIKKDEFDGSNNFYAHCACYNLKISQLNDLDKLKH